MIQSPKLFLALARRLERITAERSAAWKAGDDFRADKFTRRHFALVAAIMEIELP